MNNTEDFQRHVVLVAAITGALLLLAATDSILQYATHFDRAPCYTSILSGQDWINELIARYDSQFYYEIGMHKNVFWSLLSVLQKNTGLYDTRHISNKEQLAIFLHYAH